MSERRPRSGDSASKKTQRATPRVEGDVEVDAVAEATFDLADLVDFDSPAPEGARPRGGPRNWRALLSGSSPREVLARLMSSDPLDVRACVASVLDERVYLIEHDRVFVRAVARIARFALRYRGQPELEAWLRQQVDEAVLELLEEDAEARPAPGEEDLGLADLARPLGLDPSCARAACAAFNRSPLEERRAFQALVLAGRSLDEVAAHDGGSATEVARAARRALEAVLTAAVRKEDRK